MKRTLGLASAALLVVSLTACSDDDGGGDSSGDYCETLKNSQSKFADLDPTALDDQQFDDIVERVGELEDQAPSEVADDWATVGDQLDEFKSLLDDAGIGLDDLQGLQGGQVPEGVDVAKLQSLVPKMQEFADDEGFADAQKAIEDSAKADCDVTL